MASFVSRPTHCPVGANGSRPTGQPSLKRAVAPQARDTKRSRISLSSPDVPPPAAAAWAVPPSTRQGSPRAQLSTPARPVLRPTPSAAVSRPGTGVPQSRTSAAAAAAAVAPRRTPPQAVTTEMKKGSAALPTRQPPRALTPAGDVQAATSSSSSYSCGAQTAAPPPARGVPACAVMPQGGSRPPASWPAALPAGGPAQNAFGMLGSDVHRRVVDYLGAARRLRLCVHTPGRKLRAVGAAAVGLGRSGQYWLALYRSALARSRATLLVEMTAAELPGRVDAPAGLRAGVEDHALRAVEGVAAECAAVDRELKRLPWPVTRLDVAYPAAPLGESASFLVFLRWANAAHPHPAKPPYVARPPPYPLLCDVSTLTITCGGASVARGMEADVDRLLDVVRPARLRHLGLTLSDAPATATAAAAAGAITTTAQPSAGTRPGAPPAAATMSAIPAAAVTMRTAIRAADGKKTRRAATRFTRKRASAMSLFATDVADRTSRDVHFNGMEPETCGGCHERPFYPSLHANVACAREGGCLLLTHCIYCCDDELVRCSRCSAAQHKGCMIAGDSQDTFTCVLCDAAVV